MSDATVSDLITRIRDFADARDWGQFHSPKNLSMALAGEVGELLAELQWLNDSEVAESLATPDARQRLESEFADVLIYLLRFADVCQIDPAAAVLAKLAQNETRYPADRARGSMAKYTRYTADQESS